MIELKQIRNVLWCSGMFHGFGCKCDAGDGIPAGSVLSNGSGSRP
jgi:hypothetical protein